MPQRRDVGGGYGVLRWGRDVTASSLSRTPIPALPAPEGAMGRMSPQLICAGKSSFKLFLYFRLRITARLFFARKFTPDQVQLNTRAKVDVE